MNGSISFDYDEEVFTARVLLPLGK